ncbi:MAG: M56 family metallopeptidase [Flavobacteriaceae bacterium]
MDYLLKASAILGIFYLFYRLILHRETFFQSNRIFLLIGIIASLTLPLIMIPIYVEQTILPIQDFVIAQSSGVSETPQSINWTQIIGFMYLVGVLFFGTKFLLSLLSLGEILISSKKEKSGGFYFIKSKNNDSPFSFFNYIVYNPNSFQQQELEQILLHEKVHAYQWHSFDVLFSQIATIVFWFNPISWLYKNILQQNLEFIADSVSQEKSTCQKSYQHLLLKTSIAPNQFALTNNFYNSLIKKRIIMLHKNRSKNTNQLKFVFILPLLMAFIFTFNTKTIAQNIVKKINTKDNNRGLVLIEIEEDMQMVIITKDSKQSDLDNIKESFSKDGVTVKFKGVKRNDSGEITSIKIDVSSKQSNANFNTSSDQPIKPIKISFDEKGDHISIGNRGMLHEKHDMIFVSSDNIHKIHTSGSGNQNFFFVSDDDSNGEHTITKVIKSDGGNDNIFVINSEKKNGLFDKEKEVYFISEGGNKKKIIINKDDENNYTWNDANGNTTIEVISSGDADKTIWTTEGTNKTIKVIKLKSDIAKDDMIFIAEDNHSPLFIIDGKETSKEILEKLDANIIEKIEVLKSDKAVKKYGDKAKGGVIIITTKKK